MDASHVEWFRSVFERFAEAIANREYVGRDAIESYKSIELIETAYESARQGSRELPLHEPVQKTQRELSLPAG
jgi:hypothetical protein